MLVKRQFTLVRIPPIGLDIGNYDRNLCMSLQMINYKGPLVGMGHNFPEPRHTQESGRWHQWPCANAKRGESNHVRRRMRKCIVCTLIISAECMWYHVRNMQNVLRICMREDLCPKLMRRWTLCSILPFQNTNTWLHEYLFLKWRNVSGRRTYAKSSTPTDVDPYNRISWNVHR